MPLLQLREGDSVNAEMLHTDVPLLTYTIFDTIWPTEKKERADVEWQELIARIRDCPTYLRKADCPLISMAEYGELLSHGEKPILRHAENIKRVFGVELDYDGERMPIEEAGALLQTANIAALLYTSPSHTYQSPRWRVLAPLSEPTNPVRRMEMVGRLNRLLGGVASRESFTLSQSFYIGRVKDVEYVVHATQGRCIDLAADLEPLYWDGHSATKPRDAVTDAELRHTFELGEGRYEAMLKLSSRWAARGMPVDDIESALDALLGAGSLNADGIDLRTRIRPMAESAVRKFGESRQPLLTVPADVSRGTPRTGPDGNPPHGRMLNGDQGPSWAELKIACSPRGIPFPNLANVNAVLSNHPEVLGRIWYDEFEHRTYSTLFSEGARHEWNDHHDTRLTRWLQSVLQLHNLNQDVVKRAVLEYARTYPRHELRDWLNVLKWDGTERLPHLLADVYGVDQNDYHADVGRCWLVSMVARAMDPGCQVDTIVVLEGAQGIRKSTSLADLAGQWYASLPEAFGSRDFLQSIDGVWLAEIPDMSSFRGRDIQHIKAIITTRSDRYRRSYAYHAETYPRQCVFVATANNDDWNQDPTGARRFWPVACRSVNIEFVRSNREQLFAEALHRFRAGEKWWDVPEKEARAEQEARREEDVWQDRINAWAGLRETITMDDIFEFALAVPVEHRDQRKMKRVATVLRHLGFQRSIGRVTGSVTRSWTRTGNTG